MARTERQHRGWAPLLIGALIATGLFGCSSWTGRPRPLQIYVETGEGGKGRLRADNIAESRTAAQAVSDSFRLAREDVELIFTFIEGSRFVDEVAYRTGLGLGPDLMMARVPTTRALLLAGLTNSEPVDGPWLKTVSPELRQAVSQNGTPVMKPFVVFPQVACVNRRLMPEPPATLAELLEQAAGGKAVGLPSRFRDLAWTMNDPLMETFVRSGLKRGDPALRQLATQQDIEPAFRTWLRWIGNAGLQNNVLFFRSTSDLDRAFRDKELSWIPCRGNSIRDHVLNLGQDLVITPLPGRVEGEIPFAVTEQLMMSFGVNSTRQQSERARDFALFVLSRITQKQLTRSIVGAFPVNTGMIFSAASGRLQALQASRNRSAFESLEAAAIQGERGEALDDLVEEVSLGLMSPEEGARAVSESLKQ
ncbi:carbohydrate ABC transporter substrate-binding protein [Synechococcus sp. RSCCF101]|nr:carbohydrate ABC transporter substrate-binding protein [Synechococcus sp. RSCCF101]